MVRNHPHILLRRPLLVAKTASKICDYAEQIERFSLQTLTIAVATYCGEVPRIIGSKKIHKSGGLTKLQDLKIEGISAISYADEYR